MGNQYFFSRDLTKWPFCLYNTRIPRNRYYAEVVELADTLVSGISGSTPMGVRVPPSAFLVLPDLDTNNKIHKK